MTATPWPKVMVIPAAALPRWHALCEALATYAPPCAADPEVWHSTRPEDVQAAVRGCLPCHALTACGEYAATARERVGVWAGVDRTPRDPRRRPDHTHEVTSNCEKVTT